MMVMIPIDPTNPANDGTNSNSSDPSLINDDAHINMYPYTPPIHNSWKKPQPSLGRLATSIKRSSSPITDY